MATQDVLAGVTNSEAEVDTVDAGGLVLAAFPTQWRSARLGEVVDVLDKQRVPLNETQRQAMQGSYPYCGANGVLDHINQYLFDGEFVLLAEDGGYWGPFESSAYLMAGKFWVNNHAHIIQAVKALADNQFLVYLLNHLDIARFISGTTRGKLTQGVMVDLTLPLPPLPEQRAIARALRSVQAAIQARRRAVALERERKAALMQHLFTHGTRGEATRLTAIGEMPESWRVMRFANVLSALLDHRGKTPKKLGGDFVPTGVRIISAMNVSEGRLVLDRNERYVSPEMYTRWMPEKLHIGDVLVTSEAPLGEVAILVQSATYCLGQRLFALRANPAFLDSHFLFHLLRSEGMQSRLQARASGTTAFGIRQSELVKVPIEVPLLDEQHEIAEALTACDSKIAAMNDEATLLDELFRALLDALMTGRLSALPLVNAETMTGDATAATEGAVSA